MIAGIIISKTTRAYDTVYSYKTETHIESILKVGMRVIVPFGGGDKTREGLVVKLQSTSVYNGDESKLKSIIAVLDKEPVIDVQGLRLIKWMKKRYICTYYDAIYSLVPAGTSVRIKRYLYIKDFHSENRISKNEMKMYKYIKEKELAVETDEVYKAFEKSKANPLINSLLKKNILGIKEEYKRAGKEKTAKAATLSITEKEAKEIIESDIIKNIKEINILEILMQNEFMPLTDLMSMTSITRYSLKKMEKLNYIKILDIQKDRNSIFIAKNNIYNKKKLTDLQEEIFMELLDIQKKDEYNEALFYGITGSGKSEVYMHLIEEVIKENRSVIIMVPEIALTAQMLSMFSTRFGNNVALLHSRLSTGERYDQWHRIKKGKASIVLGTRSAVFAPVKDIGLIILDEEHDSSYKSETVPRYHAADIARKRCMDNRAFLLYGSATPRVDSFYKALSGKINFLSLEKRAVNQNLPDVSIVDMKNEVEGGKYNNLSAVFKEKLINTLKKGEQAMILLNRRGYAKIIVCMECGYKTMCPNCTISLTYHSSGNRLICHYCGYTRKKTDNCINCGSDKLVPIGTGTQQIEKELDDINESADEVIIRHGRMDIDTTGKKNSVDKIINDFRKNKQNVLVGTQMIAKGHDIHNVTLVGILSADMMLASEDFRANEKTFQLITQAAGRAGRGDKDGSVIIQCFDTENYSIESAIKHDYRNFYKNEIQIRKKLMYPPFTNIGQIMLSGKNPGQVKFEIMRLRNGTEEIIKETDTELIGPSTAPVYKINDRFRWRMVLKQRDFEILLKILTHIYDSNSDALKKKGIRLLLDINPFNML